MPATLVEWAQILFWVCAAVLAILTYIQARRTLFQPLQVELFRLQIEAAKRAVEFCGRKGPTQLVGLFRLREVVSVNAHLMLEEFAKSQFNLSSGIQDLIRESHPERIFHAERLHLAGYSIATPPSVASSPPNSDPPWFESWDRYLWTEIRFPQEYSEAIAKLNELIADPVMPTSIREVLIRLQQEISDYSYSLGAVLEEAAPELIKQFPSESSFPAPGENANLEWVQNLANRRIPEITDYRPQFSAAFREFSEDRKGEFRFGRKR